MNNDVSSEFIFDNLCIGGKIQLMFRLDNPQKYHSWYNQFISNNNFVTEYVSCGFV